MKKILLGFCIFLSLAGCAEKKPLGKYAVIDIANSIGEYQKVYCSDFFSSIELIPLETKKNSLIGNYPFVLFHDDLIFICSNVVQGIPPVRELYVFNRSGKFLNQIGKTGGGPGEFNSIHDFFLNQDKSTIYIADYTNILEYKFDGTFIRSFRKPNMDGGNLSECTYAGDNLFVGQINYNGKDKYKYCLFDQNGNTVQCFPSRFFYDKVKASVSTYEGALYPIRVDNRLYLKDFVNDTLYLLADNLHPAYVFDCGKYSISEEELIHDRPAGPATDITIAGITGTPDYIFYRLTVPQILPRPKSKPVFMLGRERSTDAVVYGVYNIERNTNMLLDTDQYLQKGMINDMDGGLPFIPDCYAGDGIMVDYWKAEDMKEMLIEEYFATQNIKDRQAHQKLIELLKNLKDEDNGVIVIAKLKRN